jgi:preprotein translocase subunit SecG
MFPWAASGAFLKVMTTFLLVLQVLAALVFVILMAVQTDKAEQSGVMGLGGQGGRNMGSIEMPVGAERILKPMSKWVAVAFLFLSSLAAINGQGKLEWWHFLVAVAVYGFVMTVGNKVWDAFVGMFGAAK